MYHIGREDKMNEMNYSGLDENDTTEKYFCEVQDPREIWSK
jgi:hypothetical protein